nr:putative membrane protein c20f10.07 [Quercus suber]
MHKGRSWNRVLLNHLSSLPHGRSLERHADAHPPRRSTQVAASALQLSEHVYGPTKSYQAGCHALIMVSVLTLVSGAVSAIFDYKARRRLRYFCGDRLSKGGLGTINPLAPESCPRDDSSRACFPLCPLLPVAIQAVALRSSTAAEALRPGTMPALEQTDTSSPRLGGALSKLRGKRHGGSISAGSVHNTSNDDIAEDGGGLRASVDAAIGKVKDRTIRRSHDDRRPSGDEVTSFNTSSSTTRSRLTSLIPGRKRRSSQGSTLDDGQSDSIRSSNGIPSPMLNESQTSLGLDDSGRSSLMTDGDHSDDGRPIRPTLSPRPSHVGYLTLSSPESNAQSHLAPSVEIPALRPPAEAFITNLTNVPHIVEPPDQDPSSSNLSSTRRSRSPAGRLKGAFTRNKSSSSGDSDPSVSTSSGAGGFGSLFKASSRRNSINLQDANASETTEVNTQDSKRSAAVAPSQGQASLNEQRPETPQQRERLILNTESVPTTPPNISETPKTLITPPTPIESSTSTFAQRIFASPTKVSPSSSRGSALSSTDSIRHRRAQSANLPSKLSHSIAPPLTPHVEEAKTPGGTLTQPTNASGFFTSFFSAAQKAADQLSTNITSSVGQGGKSKLGTAKPQNEQTGEDFGLGELDSSDGRTDVGQLPRAVDTLGKGDLSLSHLGISLTDGPSPMSSTIDLPQAEAQARSEDATRRVEEEAATRAVSMAYEKPAPSTTSQPSSRPLSIASNDRLTPTDQPISPPKSADLNMLARSGSVRSKLSGKRRRHRTSSATVATTTSNSIAAALQSSTTGLSNLAAHGPGHRLTGFAVASSRRNKEFHQLFRSVPEDDYLIEDYSAALQRDILLHGRLYVSEGHICFSSNILGWVTNLIISFDEVVSVEKKSTAVIFPNAIVIQTLQARNTFASFVARDSTYELLIGIWKISHPNLKSSLNGVALDNAGTGDKTEVADPEGSDAETADGSDDEVYDEDEDDDGGSFTDAGIPASTAGSDVGDQVVSRKPSAAPLGTPAPANGFTPKGLEHSDAVVTGAAVTADFPGPPTHAPTECSEAAEHYNRPLTDTIINAPLGKVYAIMFGTGSGTFMRKWLVEEEKSRELNYVDDKTGLDDEHKTFTFDYIKPLNNSVGPKQTKCITTNTLLAYDLSKAISIDCSTQTPDVPSGNVFTTKTRYCLMWGPNNSTRPIEKGANDGQISYVKSIIAAIEAAVTTKPPVKGVAKKGKRKGKKEIYDAEEANFQRAATVTEKKSDWGMFELLRGPLEPIVSLLRPFLTPQILIVILLMLLLYNWMWSPRSGAGVGFSGSYHPLDRARVYEDLWRKEESELWEWLEDRVGLDSIYASREQHERQKASTARTMGKRLETEKMSERQMDDAIQLTEERLLSLKDAVQRKKEKSHPIKQGA